MNEAVGGLRVSEAGPVAVVSLPNRGPIVDYVV